MPNLPIVVDCDQTQRTGLRGPDSGDRTQGTGLRGPGGPNPARNDRMVRLVRSGISNWGT